jgi:hypothetical protein
MSRAKKAFQLRIDAKTFDALQGWADDELRSLNAQIEYVIRDALRKAGRLPGDNTSQSSIKNEA